MPSINDRFRPQAPKTPGTATPAVEAQKTVDVTPPAPVSTTESQSVAKTAAEKLIEIVTQFKDRDGKMGLEGRGKGDPKVTERRSAVSTLIADKSGFVVDEAALRKISDEIAKDIDF